MVVERIVQVEFTNSLQPTHSVLDVIQLDDALTHHPGSFGDMERLAQVEWNSNRVRLTGMRLPCESGSCFEAVFDVECSRWFRFDHGVINDNVADFSESR
jgi:hypothetical protein